MSEVCKADQKCGHPLGAMHGKPRRPLRRLRTCVVGSASAVRPTDATAADREVEARTGSHERAAHPLRANESGRLGTHPEEVSLPPSPPA